MIGFHPFYFSHLDYKIYSWGVPFLLFAYSLVTSITFLFLLYRLELKLIGGGFSFAFVVKNTLIFLVFVFFILFLNFIIYENYISAYVKNDIDGWGRMGMFMYYLFMSTILFITSSLFFSKYYNNRKVLRSTAIQSSILLVVYALYIYYLFI